MGGLYEYKRNAPKAAKICAYFQKLTCKVITLLPSLLKAIIEFSLAFGINMKRSRFVKRLLFTDSFIFEQAAFRLDPQGRYGNGCCSRFSLRFPYPRTVKHRPTTKVFDTQRYSFVRLLYMRGIVLSRAKRKDFSAVSILALPACPRDLY